MEIQIQFFSSLMQSNFSSTYQKESQKLKISKVSDYSLLSISVYVFTVNSQTKFHPILVFLILISYEKVLEVKFNKKAMKHNTKCILTRESTLFSWFLYNFDYRTICIYRTWFFWFPTYKIFKRLSNKKDVME